MSNTVQSHEHWMHKALTLARRAEGMTRPNPPVGAVVVKNGCLVGQGYHKMAGGPHAEVYALKQAGARAKGATLYITLEPCSTTGRTPPCTDRIIESGVAEVVVAQSDPNPKHAGRGLRLLRKAGIRTRTGVCALEAAELIRPFARWILDGRPYVTLKLGMTFDGKIADRRGRSQWITGPQARSEVQNFRCRADAILVGAGTVSADNPSLWPRPDKGRRPFRIILDKEGKTPPSSRVYTDEHASHTLVAISKSVSANRAKRYEKSGASVVRVPDGHSAGILSLFKQLSAMGLLHVLCEGGGEMAASLIRAGVVDEYIVYVAPKIMGGDNSIGAVRGLGWLMPDLPELEFIEHKQVGPDILLRARPK